MKVLKWPGSKWSISNEIINIFPRHNIYIEPFFGSGAIFFSKAAVKTEILNDLDHDIFNLFKVIRDSSKELAELIALTPYSREEYLNSYQRSGSNIEIARQFIVRSNMARAGMQYYSSSWRHAGPVLGSKNYQRVTGEWKKLPGYILAAAERLKDAEIENCDALDLVNKYNTSDTLIYLDPPYLLSTRRQRYYNIEMTENEEHIFLLRSVINHNGPVVISGYDSELYNNQLIGWTKKYIKCNAEQGKHRTEVIWCNFQISKQINLFI